MKNHIAVIAFFIGLLAVGMAAFENNFVHVPQEPKAEEKQQTLKEVAVNTAKTLLEKKVLHKEPPPKPVTDPRRVPLHPYQMLFTGLGVLAIGLGVYAWAQREHTRLAASAIGLGLMAIAWEWVLVAVSIATLILLLSFLS